MQRALGDVPSSPYPYNPPHLTADADLHPGNILVRVTDPNSLWGRITNYFHIYTSPKLILLDVGMTAELQPEDQQNLIDLFRVLFTPPPPPPATLIQYYYGNLANNL